MTKIKSALGGIRVTQAVLSDYKTVSREDTLQHLVDLTMSGSQQDFPVLDGTNLVGMVTHKDLITALSEKGSETRVSEIMRTEFPVVDPSEMLEIAFLKLQTSDCHTLPVLHQGRLTGLLTMDNVGEFMRIQAALSRSQSV